MRHVLIGYGQLHRQRSHTVGTVYDVVFGSVFQFVERRADVDFYQLRRAFAQLDVVLPSHIFANILVELVAGNTYRLVGNDAAERYDGNLGRAAAYIDHHVAFGGFDVDAYAYGGSHRLVNHIDVATADVLGRVAHGAYLHFGAARRNAYDHTQRRGKQRIAHGNHLHHAAHHLFGGVEVGYHTVLQRADNPNVFGGASVHGLRLVSDGFEFARAVVEGDHRGGIDDDFAIINDNGVRRSQVDGYFLIERKESHIRNCVIVF